MSFQSFDLTGRVAVVTGGAGVLGAAMADALAESGVRIAILGRTKRRVEEKAAAIRANGSDAIAITADVLDEHAVHAAREQLLAEWGRIDILVNAAGGNVARSRTDDMAPFAMPIDAFDEVVKLNLHGTVIPSLAFGEAMAERGRGCIVNVSSMAAQLALSGVLGYSVAKAGIDSFTRWMAVDLARRFGDGMRVNAIAPGFFITAQNRNVLLREDGSLTDRSKNIIARTPMARFGRPEEITGAIRWLCSDASSFVTGAVIPVDGGFSSFSGV